MAEPQVRIVPLDPEDDGAFAAYVDIHRSAELEGSEYPNPFQPIELRALLRDIHGYEPWFGFLGYDDAGSPVVAGLLTITVADNLDKANLDVWVAPGLRRRGHGSAMATALVLRAAELGRTTLLSRVAYPVGADETHPHRAFVVRHGFALSNIDLHRVLDLPVDESRLVQLAEQSAPHHRRYRFVEFAGDAVPPDLLPSYLDLTNAVMADAPTGDVDYETGGVTPEMFRAEAALLKEQGRTLYGTIAIDEAGLAAAYSVLCVPDLDPGKIFQFGTLVSRPHRGHRLGLAVKVRNIATVQALHPDRSVVHTWNAASNTHMVAVNDAMGFRVVEETAEYVRRLVG